MAKIRPKLIRILYTDRDATDSSSDEEEIHLGLIVVRTPGRRIQKDIHVNNFKGRLSSRARYNASARRRRRMAVQQILRKRDKNHLRRAHNTPLASALTRSGESPSPAAGKTTETVKEPPSASPSVSSPSSVLRSNHFFLDEEDEDWSLNWLSLSDLNNSEIPLLPRCLFCDSLDSSPTLSFKDLNDNSTLNDQSKPTTPMKRTAAAAAAAAVEDEAFEFLTENKEGSFPGIEEIACLDFDCPDDPFFTWINFDVACG